MAPTGLSPLAVRRNRLGCHLDKDWQKGGRMAVALPQSSPLAHRGGAQRDLLPSASGSSPCEWPWWGGSAPGASRGASCALSGRDTPDGAGDGPHWRQPVCCTAGIPPRLGCLGKGIERVPQGHDSARKVLELARARPFHQHVATRWHCVWPPGPWGNEEGIQARFQQLIEAPRGACTFPIQTAPCMAQGGPHALLNQQQREDFPIPMPFRECASPVGSELIEIAQPLHAFDR